MNFRFMIVESSLNRVEFRWKWLKFVQWSLVLWALVAVAVLGFGIAMHKGWITHQVVATTVLTILGIVAFLSWAILMISVAAGAPSRARLANDLEGADPRLMDRVNTLLHLGEAGKDARTMGFARRIANQVQRLFIVHQPPSVYSYRQSLPALGILLLIAAVTWFFYSRYTPWQTMLKAHWAAIEAASDPKVANAEQPAELALPAPDNVEQSQVWGEVRITDPATDMKVTKVDVVPIQIEAAANHALEEVGWLTSVNGNEETLHKLPAPLEPRYAVYAPVLYLDEHRLSDWDVMTYYAKARTEKQNNYASEVYFLEVRPFREDILKLPGGESGEAYQCLSKLSSLIDRQQHIIRQTHGFAQHPPGKENVRTQDRNKLAEAEQDLSAATRHLYAEMSAGMENRPIGEALDNLAKAEGSLQTAGNMLSEDKVPDAQTRERQGLSELVAARKMFQKAVTDNPEAFDKPKPDQEPTADVAQALKEMTEFRDEAKAAREFVQTTIDQQKQLATKTLLQPRANYPRLGTEEKTLRDALEQFQEQHPEPFKGSEGECKNATGSMDKAAQALEGRSAGSRAAMDRAAADLEKLRDTMDRQSAEQQLADAYKLKKMLDRQAQELEKASQPDATPNPQETAQTAGEAKQTLDRLQQIAEQEPTRGAFGDPLRQALSSEKKQSLGQKLDQAGQMQNPQGQKNAAGQASAGLKEVSKAFSQSEPKSMQAAREKDALKPGEQDAFGVGLAELESLIKRLEAQQPTAREDQAKQGRQALNNIQNGLKERDTGSNEDGSALYAQLTELDKKLKDDEHAPIDLEFLKKLLDQLRRYSVELASHRIDTNAAQVVNIDPARLPPAYRGRIQKYFEKLSEK